MEFTDRKIKNVLIFSHKKAFSYISGNGTF